MTWKVLLKKEWKESSLRFFLNLGLLAVVYLVILYLMQRYSPLLFFLGIPAILTHVLYMFVDLIFSLRKEWKENTVYVWMNLPLPGWQLILAKLLTAFVQLMISLGVTFAFVYLFIIRAEQLIDYSVYREFAQGIVLLKEIFIKLLPFATMLIAHSAVVLGLVAVFIFLMSKIIQPLGWLVGVLITAALTTASVLFSNTAFYAAITEWGLIRTIADIPQEILFQFGDENAVEVSEKIIIHLYAGQLVYEGIILVAMFLVVSWLFDRKVQV
ncbi:hypothetical protein SAMN05421736_101535 [Evansella caseinilytica]|uniref:ABC-2 type transport system permease protein n=1 Tax=Evansella caseinilytica TaxID=1503961 RepID=A0A1H3HN59_9BACI|nr:hypothetical protein [Evansella caseinilytica]SDY16218.1 hypothetical protein SAMN05421736_101535 [Evansella caseinilytica]